MTDNNDSNKKDMFILNSEESVPQYTPKPVGSPLKADGFDSCIVGVCLDSMRIAYSKQKMVELLVLQEGMEWGDAIDYLVFKTWGAYMGEHTPIYLDDYDVIYSKN